MPADERSPKRGLKDVSHFFLSSIKPAAETKQEAPQPQGRPKRILGISPHTECSSDWIQSLKHRWESSGLRVFLWDFHGDRLFSRAHVSFLEDRTAPFLNVDSDLIDTAGGRLSSDVILTDFPWCRPGWREAVLASADRILMNVRLSSAGLKDAFRFLKSARPYARRVPVVVWEGDGVVAHSEWSGAWCALVSQFLNFNLRHVENLETFPNQDRDLHDRKKEWSHTHASSSFFSGRETAFFRNGRLDVKEIDALFELARRHATAPNVAP